MENREIPKGWREETLVDLLESLIDYRGKTPEKSETGIQVLSAKSVKMGYIDYSQVYYISEETYKNFMVRGFPKNGDILMTTEAPLGCIAKLDKDKITPAQRLLTLRGKTGVLDNDFLMYFLMSENGQHELHSRASGTTVQGIKRSEFINVKITLPESYEEQVAIGQVLSSLDEKIELLEEENKTLETLAQTIFTEWFVNFNFPGATGEMEDSELGEIPKGWRVVELRELFSFVKGKKPKATSEEFLDDYLPQILIDTFDGGKPCYGLNDKVVLAAEDDLLMVMDGASSGRIEFGYSGIVGSTLALLKIENDIKSVVYFFLKQKESDIKANTTGSAIPHTDKERVYRYKITYSDEVIQELEIVLSSFRKKIILNRKQIQTLKITRDTLLPKLTTGEIRVEEFGE